MATKLCCTAEQDERSGSPELPNARVTEATPAKAPLLPKRPPSQSSHFTSARTDELHELRQIFDNAKGDAPSSPMRRKVGRGHFVRPSVHSLHSLHKMKSMHSIIRQKFSKDLSKTSSTNNMKNGGGKRSSQIVNDDTVLRQLDNSPNTQLHVTKDDLRKNLLTDKKSDEGGYDSDAEILHDIARDMGKRSPSKRPSVHSIEWASSTNSKPTPGSSSKSRQNVSGPKDVKPYQIKKPQLTVGSARFSQFFSTPDLQNEPAKLQERKLRRSHSATSANPPQPRALSPLQLLSLDANGEESVHWSDTLKESLRLSHFTALPHAKQPNDSFDVVEKKEAEIMRQDKPVDQSSPSVQSRANDPQTPATVVQIRVQEPTAVATPRNSTSIRDNVSENVPFPHKEVASDEVASQDESEARRSVHLYSMRISHHLRSGSLLSWDNVADTADLPNPPRAFRDRSVSDLSRMSQLQKQQSRHERHTSSSGFASSKVPSRWGTVIAQEVREDKSSVYSSRPQSPPDSFGGSMVNLSRLTTHRAKDSSNDLPKLRRSTSYPTDNDETPRPTQRYGLTGLRDVTSYSVLQRPSAEIPPLPRKNSIASTKKSKFHEEFSPPPPLKKMLPSTSIMRFLKPKRSTVRSRSEAAIQPAVVGTAVDGLLEIPGAVTEQQRRQSKSMISIEAERKSLRQDREAGSMWERALKTHQDERAAMFLPQNKEFATHSSPLRQRSASISRPRSSEGTEASASEKSKSTRRVSAPPHEPPSPGLFSSRRRAFVNDVAEGVSPSNGFCADDAEVVGAWGRYPSHSRHDRTLSLGRKDRVDSRDFALEAAMRFAMGKDTEDDDSIDPTQRLPTPPLSAGEKKRKKKVGHARMAKSNSMTFGKNFLKNYTRIFRSQSIEFTKHGAGHRSSISTGGTLKYPELEILPDVWRRGIAEEGSGSGNHRIGVHEHQDVQEEYGPGDKKGKGKIRDERSPPATRLRSFSNLDPTVSPPRFDGSAEAGHSRDTARVLSAYYENCLPSLPRGSADFESALDRMGTSMRNSFDNSHPYTHPNTVPRQSAKHSRTASRVSRASIGSVQPSSASIAEDKNRPSRRSTFSVRRSTMDLVTLYKKQEDRERERALGLMRKESEREKVSLAGL